MPAADSAPALVKARTPFPGHGRSRPDVLAALEEHHKDDADWRGGRVPLYVFGSLPEIEAIGKAAYLAYFSENALGARRAFKGLGRMEAEVLDMALDLFAAPPGARGAMTSGGTESILLAVKASRDHARASSGKPSLRGNLVLPESAHPAFDKAARLMDLEVRRVPLAGDFRASVAAMSDALDGETILVVGSAPCFPYGVIDPIAELSELTLARGVWLHVDACVGGYLAPFARDLGYPIPEFDFSLPGVASLSADLHKFGFCPKPASTILFRDAARAECGKFDLDVWPSGRFTTGTLVGTRPGGGVAAAWAVLNFLGRDGYRTLAQRLMTMRERYVAGIEAISGMRVFGRPALTIIAFGSPVVDMPAVQREMEGRGWIPGLIRKPPGLHLMASLLHENVRDRYLDDLAAAVAAAPPAAGSAVAAVY